MPAYFCQYCQLCIVLVKVLQGRRKGTFVTCCQHGNNRPAGLCCQPDITILQQSHKPKMLCGSKQQNPCDIQSPQKGVILCTAGPWLPCIQQSTGCAGKTFQISFCGCCHFLMHFQSYDFLDL